MCRVNCPFYLKIGACRHGDRCSRVHNRPLTSPTILLKNMYVNPAAHMSIVDGTALGNTFCLFSDLLNWVEYDEKENLEHFEEFVQDIYQELSKFGVVEDIKVCDNLGEHLLGNVYIKFADEASAKAALQNLHGRYYAGLSYLDM